MDPGACYLVTITLPETMAPGDWLFYMIFNQDNFRYNINKTFGVTDPTVTWVGTYGSCWNYPDNWNPSGVPNSGSNVVIPSGVSNNPSLNENGFCNNLEVNSGGQLDIPDFTLYVYNNLINNGYVYQTGGTLGLYGTITNTGTYDADDGTFLYGGTAISQTIAPSIDYNNLKATGENKVLSGNTSVYGSTYLDGASIGIGNYDYTSYSHQFTQTTPDQDYIITSGTGALRYSSVSTPTVVSGTFPVGPDANNYNPVTINNNGVALNWFETYVQPGIVPSHPNAPWCLPLTWDIKCDPLSLWNATIGFEWSLSQENALFTAARQSNNGVLNICEENAWQSLGPVSFTSLGDARYSAGFNNLMLVSGCAIGDGDHTLPVELSSFTAVYSNDFVTVQWATASETDVIGFNIYRALEESFEDAEKVNVSLIPGHETTNQPNEYSFIDETADAYFTTYYYWLEAVNYGGTSNIYGSIQYDPADVDGDGQLNTVVRSILDNCFPNPVQVGENITFNFMIGGLEGTMPQVSLNIYNIKGELVKKVINEKMVVNGYTKTWCVDNIANGVYFYQLKTENYQETKKLLIQ
ncbi:T9SS C-terminal target domain-containing protein [bacterium]|nr:MAG: T9SS C-terminal target domain-containing protein [bacterium]